jgi:hypothetical protein
MKPILPITLAAVCALFTACDTRVNTDGKPDTTIVNPPATKSETNTTVVNPPATEKKTETNTTVTPSGSTQSTTTETKK